MYQSKLQAGVKHQLHANDKMPRKEASDIHPALVASTIASAAKQQNYGSQIDGWESFTSEMKAFLWVRQFHAKDSGALAYIGRSQSWLT